MAFSKGHALIVGVGNNQHASYLNVPITVADARAVAVALQDGRICGYPPDQVTLLHDGEASKEGILTGLSELAGRVSLEDTALVYYCGHGVLGTDGQYYLVSSDARLKHGRVVKGTGVSEGELIAQLQQIPAERVLMIFNACFSGHISPTLDAGQEPLDADTLSEDASRALLATGKGRIIITACGQDQSSFIGSGSLTIFTQALVDGLKGRGVRNSGGYISAYSLYESVYERVSETVQEEFSETQEPELTVLKGVGPFAVALYRGAADLGEFDDQQPPPDLPAVRQVTEEKAQKAITRQIGSAGGDIITTGDIRDNVGVTIGRGSRTDVKQTPN